MPEGSFWKNRRVLVTGHTGFKGSWLSLWLNALGARVSGYALPPPTEPSLFQQAAVGIAVQTIYGDIRDFERLNAAIARCDPEIIFHMAAQSVVTRGYEDPIETYGSNVMGTVHLLEALRRSKRSCVVVNITSDKCYENREWIWGYRENDPLGGADPYSSSKACSELVTDAFRESFFPAHSYESHGIAVATARAGNVIGGGDWTHNQLIPDLMRAFLAGRTCVIRNPHAIRPWQFVLDPLRGYLLLGRQLVDNGPRFASSWNFGPPQTDGKPVSWIADRVACLWGHNVSWRHGESKYSKEAGSLMLDSSKARTYLGWHPTISLCAALDWTTDWYRAYQQGRDLIRTTRSQLERYEALTANNTASESVSAASVDVSTALDTCV